jgi:hypothetical protein
MAKKIILLVLLSIALMVSSCVWYGGHGHGYYGYDYPRYDHHRSPGWDRHHHGGGDRDWR